MIKYEVGQRFPHEKYLNRRELTLSILNECFFDVFISLNGITSQERKSFKKGRLNVFLYDNSDIPFIVFDFGDEFYFDISIDLTKITGEQQNKWLNSEANSINLFLVNSETGILEAMRLIGINFSNEIRDILERQTGHEDVDFKISQVLHVVSSKEMKQKSKFKQTFIYH